jgi:hypothetical protein
VVMCFKREGCILTVDDTTASTESQPFEQLLREGKIMVRTFGLI